MSASVRAGEHIRRNAVAYVALFVALSGTSYAASKIKTGDIKKNAITSKLVKDGQIATADLADQAVTEQKLAAGAVTEQKLAFQAATQAELDAFLDSLAAGGTVNNPSNPVDFTKLKNVPAGLADGEDNTGAAPANNSLGAAEPAVADDEIVDGSIDAEDLTNDVALLDQNQTFSAPKSFSSSVFFNFDDTERLELDGIQSGTGGGGPFAASLDNDTTADTQEVGVFLNANGGTGVTERLLRLVNFDNQAVGAGIQFDPLGQPITTGVDASAANLGTALAVGDNDITTSGATISAAELATLDGTPTDSVNLPLGSFFNVTDGATLDFTPSDGSSPDLAISGGRPFIEWDDDSDGAGANVADIDSVATNFMVPPDYASGGRIRLTYREFHTTGGNPERIVCDGSENDGAFGADDTQLTGVPAFIGGFIDPVVDYDANDSIVIRCRVDDGADGTTADDPLRLHSMEFVYNATR
jgi:hypothetical protein